MLCDLGEFRRPASDNLDVNRFQLGFMEVGKTHNFFLKLKIVKKNISGEPA